MFSPGTHCSICPWSVGGIGWNWLEHGFAALMVQLQSVCSQLALSILSEPQIMMVVISNLELKEMLSGSECLGFLSWAQGG